MKKVKVSFGRVYDMFSLVYSCDQYDKAITVATDILEHVESEKDITRFSVEFVKDEDVEFVEEEECTA